MERDRRLSLMVGSFVLLSLVMLAGMVLFLTSERGLWKAHYTLTVDFQDAQGLAAGSPVMLAGKEVGIVKTVAFAPLPATDRPPVRVELQIERGVQERIRSDSMALIDTFGLLGDKYVALTLGTEAGRVLKSGEMLRGVTPLTLNDVIIKGTTALDHVATLAGNINRLVEGESAKGATGKIGETLVGVSAIVSEIQKGDGLLHSLIYDRYQGGGVASIEHSLAILEDILGEIEKGDGVFHALIYEPAEEQDIVNQALAAGARLNSILAKIDRGEGTLGLLLNDPTVYEDIKLLLGGARKSSVLSALMRWAQPSGSE